MTRKQKEQLEPALAPLRSLVGKEDFLELALVYIQREMNYVIYNVDEAGTKNCLCLRCYYDGYCPEPEGLVVISAEENPADLKKLLRRYAGYEWCQYFTYDDVDELLIWIQRDGEDLREKYSSLTETVQKALGFLEEWKYGWWLDEDEM